RRDTLFAGLSDTVLAGLAGLWKPRDAQDNGVGPGPHPNSQWRRFDAMQGITGHDPTSRRHQRIGERFEQHNDLAFARIQRSCSGLKGADNVRSLHVYSLTPPTGWSGRRPRWDRSVR